MVGLVVAAHGSLAQELVKTAMRIAGDIPAIATVSVDFDCTSEQQREAFAEVLRSVDQGQGVLVLADLYGGTPCNQSLSLCGAHSLEVLTGVNLPMLLKANSLRQQESTLPRLAQALTAYTQANIRCATPGGRQAAAVA